MFPTRPITTLTTPRHLYSSSPLRFRRLLFSPHHTRHSHTKGPSLRGRRCLITGGTSGIGYEIASTFAKAGVRAVGIVGRDRGRVDGAIEKLMRGKVGNGDVEYIPVVADVGKGAPDLTKYGGFDILVNAAGITHQSLLLSTTEDVVRNVVDTNLLGTILMSKAFIKHVTKFRLKRRSSGSDDASSTDACIINISSLLGVKGGRGSSVYAASKAGIIAFSRALALECSVKRVGDATIRVNTIVPGYIDTAMTEAYSDVTRSQISESIPLHRFGTASEVAEAAVFLATNTYAHNCVLNVDGGLSAS